MSSEPVFRLRAAAAAASAVVDGVQPGQWALPTPCTEWNVGELVMHMAGGNLLFAEAVAGTDGTAGSGGIGTATAVLRVDCASAAPEDVKSAYRAATASLITAFEEPGALEKTVDVPFGTVPGSVALELRATELLTHAWDVATATGQRVAAPEAVAVAAIAFSEAALLKIPVGRTPFGPSQPAGEDAGAIERLVALLGRPVTVAMDS